MYLLLIFIDPLIFPIYYLLQVRQENAPAAKQSSTNAVANRRSSTDRTEGIVITVQEGLNAVAEPKSDKWPNETILTNGHPEHCKVHTVEACASEDHFLPLDNEKAEVTKVEQKRDQPPLAAEEGKEEGEISNDDDTETVQTSEGERMKQEDALGSLNQYVFIVNMSGL